MSHASGQPPRYTVTLAPDAPDAHGQKKHRSYEVRVSLNCTTYLRTWSVRRAYREFAQLHDVLKVSLPSLPPMPPKSNFRIRLSPQFNSKRHQALEQVLTVAVCEDPALQRFAELRVFLNAKDSSAASSPDAADGPSAASDAAVAESDVLRLHTQDEITICPRGHALREITAAVDNYKCDMCGSTFLKGKLLWSCSICFFYVCEACGHKAVPDSLNDQDSYHKVTGSPLVDGHSSEQSGKDDDDLSASATAVANGLNCPRGHALREFTAAVDNYKCDMCGSTFLKGTLLWGCSICFFDVCEVCGLKAVPDSRPDQDSYQPDLMSAVPDTGSVLVNGYSSEQSGKDDDDLCASATAVAKSCPPEPPSKDEILKCSRGHEHFNISPLEHADHDDVDPNSPGPHVKNDETFHDTPLPVSSFVRVEPPMEAGRSCGEVVAEEVTVAHAMESMEVPEAMAAGAEDLGTGKRDGNHAVSSDAGKSVISDSIDQAVAVQVVAEEVTVAHAMESMEVPEAMAAGAEDLGTGKRDGNHAVSSDAGKSLISDSIDQAVAVQVVAEEVTVAHAMESMEVPEAMAAGAEDLGTGERDGNHAVSSDAGKSLISDSIDEGVAVLPHEAVDVGLRRSSAPAACDVIAFDAAREQFSNPPPKDRAETSFDSEVALSRATGEKTWTVRSPPDWALRNR